ncbi:MAG TPA: hypothetical protein VGO45_13390 [Bacteroidia bacterium]|jgi:hypothetical protein|nr:hypothetical protein [Bacteroidia bacterium]
MKKIISAGFGLILFLLLSHAAVAQTATPDPKLHLHKNKTISPQDAVVDTSGAPARKGIGHHKHTNNGNHTGYTPDDAHQDSLAPVPTLKLHGRKQ